MVGANFLMHLSARRWLNQLHDDLGKAGLAAAAAIPGVSAVLDQHAAAVRDATTIGFDSAATAAGATGLVLLASYGRGVLSHARAHGWQPLPADLMSWRTADWISLRLTAVCALARQRVNTPPSAPPLLA